jgi:hypothetical protein
MSRILSLSTSSILFLTCICSAQTNSLKSNFENEFFRSARNSFFMAQQENPIISAGENNFYKPVQAVIDNSVRYNYSYTPEGLSCKLSEVLISGSWEPVRRETSEYNSNGLLSGVLYEDMASGFLTQSFSIHTMQQGSWIRIWPQFTWIAFQPYYFLQTIATSRDSLQKFCPNIRKMIHGLI